MTKILHVSSAFDVDFPGGITNYVRTLASSQLAAGNEVAVLDGGEHETWTSHPLGFMVRGHRATRVQHFSLRSPEDAEVSDSVLDVVRELQPDLVHFHLTIGVGVAFYRRFAELGIPYVISLHDYFLYCPRITMMDWRNTDCGGPEKHKCERCIGVLDQVDLLRRGGRKLSLPLPRIPSRSVTRRNEVISDFFGAAARILPVAARVEELYRREYPGASYTVSHIGSESALAPRLEKTSSARLRLTALGTLSKYKGAEVLAALARRLPKDRVEVRFHGRVDEPRWGRLAEEAGIDLRGPYRPDDLPGILQETDLGVMVPVWEDNAPQVVMEFLNSGTPVLATRMGGIPDFVDERNGFLFDHRSEAELTAAVEFASSLTPERARAWGASLPRLATPADHQRELGRIYEEALTA
ncbi:glycosyltransferase [Amnibacterium kyonggiense]|uniref:Glycosyltransferase involved in cell wall biosynthesis n=1 Tax=Amnibacterium kyonggiense TaxID=595671 RepID=A0A4R7FFI1_9MICO|nr:glycosyltransferase [Amnibacterium kyonggiense]TDS74951.1 glycosyltransferase involved in cell wall biosynthesis [Amnibacterium kyonggiense]